MVIRSVVHEREKMVRDIICAKATNMFVINNKSATSIAGLLDGFPMSDTLLDIFKLLSQLGGITIAIVIPMYIFLQKPIDTFIAKRFSHKFDIQLEEKRANLETDLEKYKGDIIHEIERSKANFDIKKSILLKVYERRIEAYSSMITQTLILSELLNMWPTIDGFTRTQVFEKSLSKFDDYNTAYQKVIAFLDDQNLLEDNGSFYIACVRLFSKYEKTNEKYSNEDLEIIQKLNTSASNMINKYRGEMFKLPEIQMNAPEIF